MMCPFVSGEEILPERPATINDKPGAVIIKIAIALRI
jgi:hypothetical protein